MLSREGKLFVLFFAVFSVIVVASGIFGEVEYSLPGLDFELNLPELRGTGTEIRLPDDWEEENLQAFPDNSSEITLVNRGDETKDVKLSLSLEPEITKNKVKIFVNGRRVESSEIFGRQEIITRSFTLTPGENNVSVSVGKCLQGCFNIETDSLEIIDERRIREEEVFFSKNWEEINGKIVAESVPELQIHNFGDSADIARVSFNFVAETPSGEVVTLHEGKEVDRFSVHEDFRHYRSKAFDLEPGENILTFDIPETTRLDIEDFKIERNVGNEFHFGKDWYPREDWYHGTPRRYFDFHWMAEKSTVYFYTEKKTRLNIGIEAATYNPPKTLAVSVNNETVGRREIDFTVDERRENIVFENITFREGENIIELESTEGCDIPAEVDDKDDDRCLSFAVYDVSKGEIAEEIEVERAGLQRSYYLTAVFLVFVLSLIVHLKDLKSFRLPNKKIMAVAAVIFMVAFIFRAAQPRTYQMYLDEPWNIEVAESLRKDYRPEICSYEGRERVCEEYYKPAGYPYYLSFLFSFFGFNLSLVFWNSILLSSASCVLVFVLGYLTTGKTKLSALAALTFSVVPIHVFWSSTAESYVVSFFFVLLSLVFLYVYFSKEKRLWLFTALTTAMFAVTMRIENVLLVPIFAVLIYKEGNFEDYWPDNHRSGAVLAVPVALFLGYLGFLFYSAGQYITVTEIRPTEITGYFPVSLALPFVLLTVFFGMYLMKSHDGKLFRFTLVWILLLSPVFIFQTGTGRMFIPLILVLTFSVAEILSWLVEKMDVKRYRILSAFFVSLLVVSVGIYVLPEHEEIDAKVLQTDVITEIRGDVPENCYIVTEHSSILAGTGTRRIKTEYALENKEEITEISQEDCILYFEGIGCETGIEEGGWTRRCDEIEEQYNLTIYETYRKGEFKYTLHKIDGNHV